MVVVNTAHEKRRGRSWVNGLSTIMFGTNGAMTQVIKSTNDGQIVVTVDLPEDHEGVPAETIKELVGMLERLAIAVSLAYHNELAALEATSEWSKAIEQEGEQS